MSAESQGLDALSKLFASYVNDYEMLRELVEVETGTTVEDAINILLDTGVRSAPVWDKHAKKYIGWLDTRDLVALVVQAHHSEASHGVTDLKSMLLRSRAIDRSPVEGVVDLSRNNPFVPVYAGQLMVDVLVVLAEGVHRVPVIDPETGKITKIISQSDILAFLSRNADTIGPVVDHTIDELGIARRESIVAVPASASPIRAFELMAEHKLSGLPVVEDATGDLLTAISSTDVTQLIRHKKYDRLRHHHGEGSVLDFVSEVRLSKTGDFVAVASCSPQWTLRKAIAKLVATRIHRLYVVEASGRRLLGVVSLRNILQAVSTAGSGK